jgi:chlorophyll(ide) b reductase
MDGRGALGEATPESAAYGATKRAIPQLARSLAKECKGTGVSVHTVSPGMVVTGLLVPEDQRTTNRGLIRIVNILAELPETVAEWMVPRLRGVKGTGKYFRFLTAHGVLYRFATAPFRTHRLLPMPSRTKTE